MLAVDLLKCTLHGGSGRFTLLECHRLAAPVEKRCPANQDSSLGWGYLVLAEPLYLPTSMTFTLALQCLEKRTEHQLEIEVMCELEAFRTVGNLTIDGFLNTIAIYFECCSGCY